MAAALTVFGLCVAVCLLAHVAILRSVLRGGARSLEVDAAARRRTRFVETVWAVLPAVALALVLIATWPRVRSRDSTPAAQEKLTR